VIEIAEVGGLRHRYERRAALRRWGIVWHVTPFITASKSPVHRLRPELAHFTSHT